MATVENITLQIMAYVLYWSRFLFSVALIYAIIKLFTGAEGFGDWLKGIWDKLPGRDPNPRPPRPRPNPPPPNTPDGPLDYSQFGTFQFVITNQDDSPREGAFVKVWGGAVKTKFANLPTGKDGFWPNVPQPAPPGQYQFLVSYKLPPRMKYLQNLDHSNWQKLTRFVFRVTQLRRLPFVTDRSPSSRHYETKGQFWVRPQQHTVVPVKLPFMSERVLGFEPKIVAVERYTEPGTGAKKVRLVGKIVTEA